MYRIIFFDFQSKRSKKYISRVLKQKMPFKSFQSRNSSWQQSVPWSYRQLANRTPTVPWSTNGHHGSEGPESRCWWRRLPLRSPLACKQRETERPLYFFWLKIQGFFLSCGGTWLEFLWGGGTKLELRYWVRIVIINQIPPGGGTENLESRNLSRKKVSCTTILQSTWRGHFLLAPSGALIAIPTYYWSTTPPHPLFQITPVLNTGLSLSEPLQLYKGYKAI